MNKSQGGKKDAGRQELSITEKMGQLLRVLFDDNQSEMARALGLSQAIISKVIRGEREPGPKVIQALKEHPRVNADWLMGRGGDPLRAESLDVAPPLTAAVGDWFAPVATRILPGRPEDHVSMFRGELVPLARSYHRPTRYLLQIQEDDPIVGVASLRIAPGDLLLMDADTEPWATGLSVLVGRIVAIRIARESGIDFALARILRDTRSRGISIDLIGIGEIDPGCETKPTPRPTIPQRAGPSQPAPRMPNIGPISYSRAITFDSDADKMSILARENSNASEEADDGPSGSRDPGAGDVTEDSGRIDGRSSSPEDEAQISARDLVAFCVMMIRPDPGGVSQDRGR